MPATVNGLPLHPLVVHAVVVLLPLAVLGVVAITVRPRLRARFGVLVVVVTALATAAIPVATSTGEGLEARVGDPGVHAELGDTLIFFAVPLLAVAALLVWVVPRNTGRRPWMGVLVTVLALLIAAANLVQVYRVGESGARAVWGGAATASHAETWRVRLR
ncbi:hypothetical protein GCM10010399_00550 [Dactylosporangium fulvum]|uniref:DUF2231 domain-containing protein n=1 Tax=Dactylosporangium fulvum TaxID=53359 RepID=A0ABY5VT14_9ACTN|nr:DUF2231 domain-containing protein [Dactylosporangium fulvum]UWP79618.1 hypothetical protein Dfulv_31210 [Dactylosporangium fulvum]